LSERQTSDPFREETDGLRTSEPLGVLFVALRHATNARHDPAVQDGGAQSETGASRERERMWWSMSGPDETRARIWTRKGRSVRTMSRSAQEVGSFDPAERG
jgi:hypothetical protein